MSRTRLNMNSEIRRVADAASDRVRMCAQESGNREVLKILDTICDGQRTFTQRAQYIDVMTAEAKRLGDSERVAELRTMQEELVRDLNRFKFLAETAFEFINSKIEGA